ncbi:MAG: glycosyltransferase [Sphingomicrobium sp.]
MSRDDPDTGPPGAPMLICDLTQSWSEVGGGVGTYLRHKRCHILERTPHRHLLIVPGAHDTVSEEGRAITVTVASPHVPGSPNYRLLLRNGAVRKALERFRPDIIECQDAYNLPWAALAHRKRYPATALVAAYCTDFPTVYVEKPFSKVVGRHLAAAAARICYLYCGALYSRFDAVFALSENGGAVRLRSLGVDNVDIVPLGVELGDFGLSRRDETLRAALGVGPGQPLLIYAGRLDSEKKAEVVVEAFQRLPAELGATLVLLGEGPLREEFAALGHPRLVTPGFVRNRGDLARWLASADLYVTAFADETFGVSIVEAQASGLPVIGVSAGALIDRVTPEIGRLGAVGDAAAMAENIVGLWNAEDRAAMGERARERARQYSWDSSMEVLFGRVYRDALATPAAARLQRAPAAAPSLA